MKIPWTERLKIKNTPSLIEGYYHLYQIPCAESCIDFINRFCFTYDPRLSTEKVIPFELYDKQEKYIEWLWNRYNNREDGAVDKCRDAGATWLTMAFFVWLLIFHKNVSIGVYTYKGDECHKLGDISTLIEKAIFIINHLPNKFIEYTEHIHMYISDKRTGSDICGSSGKHPGRSGRRSIFLKDECAFYEQAELIEAATSENTDCIIDVSTHAGTNTIFYRKVTAGAISVFEFDWWDVPTHDQEWYNKKRQKAIDHGLLHVFKREVDRDAGASVESVVIPGDWINAACRINNDLSGKIIAGMDVADEGQDTNALCIVNGAMPIYCDETGGLDPGDATDRFFWKAVDMGAEEFRYDCIGVGAGVKVRLKEILARLPKEHPAHKIKLVPWAASSAVVRPEEMDFQDKKNVDLFENAKAQAWWKAREECRNTFRFCEDKDHDESQLINFDQIKDTSLGKKLIRELSQPQWKMSARGRIVIDKKPKGTKSPNIAEAYIITRAECTPAWVEWQTI